MTTTTLHPLKIHALSNEDTYAIVRTTIEVATPVKENMDTTSVAALNKLDETSVLLGNRIKSENYKLLTKEINTLNKESDLLLGEIKKRISTAQKSLIDPELAQKAEKANSFFEPYKNIDKLPQNTQFQVTQEMITKLAANAEMTAIFADLGNDKVIEVLQPKNTRFAETWKMRNDLMGDQKEVPNATTTKRETTKAYTLFCSALINLQKLNPAPEVSALIQDINAIRAKYAAIANAAKTKKPSK